MDLDVLVALSVREKHDVYGRFIKPSSLSEIAWTIWIAMGEWLQHNQKADKVNWQAFSAWFALVRHAKMSKDKLQAHKHFIDALETHVTNEENIKPLMEGLAKRDYASRIGDTALRVADGDYSVDMVHIESLLDEYNKQLGKLDDNSKYFGSFDLDSLESVAQPGLAWRLRSLNDACGDLRQGDLLVFGKRPDAGGTTFMACEATFMAEQIRGTGQRILWLNNEEQGNKVRRRIVQAALGWSTAEMEDMTTALAEYDRLVGRDAIMVYDRAKIHVKDVEKLCEELQPALIICDQLRKFKGFESDNNDVQRQEAIFNWSREICKEYAPLMAVHQAGAEAENRKWVTMDMLYGAKTGPQGEADTILTLGRTHTSGNTRYLYIPKNKLLTPGDPSLRNGKFELELVPDRARFREYE